MWWKRGRPRNTVPGTVHTVRKVQPIMQAGLMDPKKVTMMRQMRHIIIMKEREAMEAEAAVETDMVADLVRTFLHPR